MEEDEITLRTGKDVEELFYSLVELILTSVRDGYEVSEVQELSECFELVLKHRATDLLIKHFDLDEDLAIEIYDKHFDEDGNYLT